MKGTPFYPQCNMRTPTLQFWKALGGVYRSLTSAPPPRGAVRPSYIKPVYNPCLLFTYSWEQASKFCPKKASKCTNSTSPE